MAVDHLKHKLHIGIYSIYKHIFIVLLSLSMRSGVGNGRAAR